MRGVHAFDVLGDPVRRRILELLADGEMTSGGVARRDPGRVRHLPAGGVAAPAGAARSGFATVRPEGARRLYAVSAEPLRDVDDWLGRFRRFWTPHLDALETEIARGKRQRRTPG